MVSDFVLYYDKIVHDMACITVNILCGAVVEPVDSVLLIPDF
jgi:hypothetical protein